MKKNLLQKWYVHQQLELTHIIRIMKLSVFFIFVFLFQLQAGNVKSQEVRVTLSKSSLKLKEKNEYKEHGQFHNSYNMC